MIEHVDKIKEGLRNCKGKCRKCIWRNDLSRECTLFGIAAVYIEELEDDNADKMTYCKDCIYCKKQDAIYRYESDKYECTNREGLPFVLAIDPMDYCSRGKRK